MPTCVAVTTMHRSVICPKCGITKKSGKITCCGHGGSWFKKCGMPGDTKVDHTWHDGLQSCAQFKTFQVKGAMEESNDFSYGMASANSESIITISKPLGLTSTAMSVASPITGVKKPFNTRGLFATSITNSGVINAAVDTKILTSANTSQPMSNMRTIDVAITTSARVLMNHNSSNTTMTSPWHTLVTSQGCKQLLELTTFISIYIYVAFV